MMASEAHLNLKYFLRQLNKKKNKEDESTREKERESEKAEKNLAKWQKTNKKCSRKTNVK